jgi:GAF domain-containing protein
MKTDDFPGDLKGLQDALVNTRNIDQFLRELAVLATRAVGSDLSCAMAIGPGARPAKVACSDPAAAKLEALVSALDSGPTRRAIRDGRMIRIDDTAAHAHGLAARPQWPEFSRHAAAHGIRSCLALPLSSDGQPIGALNLYARDPGAFGEAEARRAADFAANASGALAVAIRLASDATLIDQLRSSLASRTVIDQALGIIMARENCTQARAFAVLRAASQHRNVKLRDIAAGLVTDVSGEPPQPPPAFADN